MNLWIESFGQEGAVRISRCSYDPKRLNDYKVATAETLTGEGYATTGYLPARGLRCLLAEHEYDLSMPVCDFTKEWRDFGRQEIVINNKAGYSIQDVGNLFEDCPSHPMIYIKDSYSWLRCRYEGVFESADIKDIVVPYKLFHTCRFFQLDNVQRNGQMLGVSEMTKSQDCETGRWIVRENPTLHWRIKDCQNTMSRQELNEHIKGGKCVAANVEFSFGIDEHTDFDFKFPCMEIGDECVTVSGQLTMDEEGRFSSIRQIRVEKMIVEGNHLTKKKDMPVDTQVRHASYWLLARSLVPSLALEK